MEKANHYTKAGNWFTLGAVTAALSALISQTLTPLLVAAGISALAYHYYTLGKKEN